MTRFAQDDAPFSLSVVIPNRNDSKYLPRCIRSIVSQDVKPDEFILIDDESTDDSIEVIRREIADHPFARLEINPKNLGGVQTANRGLRMAKGKFLLFMGANDFILPGHFARMKTCLERYPYAGLWSGMVWLVDEQDRYLRMHPSPVVALGDTYFTGEQCRRMVHAFGSWLTGQTTVYRREALLEAGALDPSLKGLNDLLAALVVASRYGAAYSPAPVGVMRIHENAFLPATLQDAPELERILGEVEVRGPKVEPALFTSKVLKRTRSRFYFASLRLSNGATLEHVQSRSGPIRRFALATVGALPRSLERVRVALFFIVMRPFELLPTVWYRVLGAGFVLLREKLAGRAPPAPEGS
jgi:glycosyltransferase involved in cell wall biosynthesis